MLENKWVNIEESKGENLRKRLESEKFSVKVIEELESKFDFEVRVLKRDGNGYLQSILAGSTPAL